MLSTYREQKWLEFAQEGGRFFSAFSCLGNGKIANTRAPNDDGAPWKDRTESLPKKSVLLLALSHKRKRTLETIVPLPCANSDALHGELVRESGVATPAFCFFALFTA